MNRIWFNKNVSLEDFSGWAKNNMAEHLGIQFIEVGDDFVKASMPVDHRTHQPYGLLHGGASVALAETVGSVGSALIIDPDKYLCVGLEINANHIRGIKKGLVWGTASPVHLGRSTHIWQIHIKDDSEKLVCISRLTVAILKKEK